MQSIPPGWSRITVEEVILDGDRYWSLVHDKWMPCKSSVGGTIKSEFSYDMVVIRKSGPEPEKEWLNPWD